MGEIGEKLENPHRHAVEKLYAHLNSGAQGLGQPEAMQWLAKYGTNHANKGRGPRRR